MAQKTLINGTAYEITQGRTLVGGTGYDISHGRTKVGGTGYDILLGMRLGELPVGDSTYMNVDGVLTEFLIVHKGNPDSAIYDDSCNGVWVLMKGVCTRHHWDTESAHYPDSDIHNYLNNDFVYRLDANFRSKIKEVKIPYAKPAVSSVDTENDYSSISLGSDGLSTKVFLLSAPEVGWNAMTGHIHYYNYEGSCLDYFKDMESIDLRRGGIPHPTNPDAPYANWWLRSKVRVYYDNQKNVFLVREYGGSEESRSYVGSNAEAKNGVWVRPAMILPSELLINRNTHAIICK